MPARKRSNGVPEAAHVDLPWRGMAIGPKLLLPVEEKNGRLNFPLMRMDCDKVGPGTCGSTSRLCARCAAAPAPRFKGAAAGVLLDLLLRYDALAGVTAGEPGSTESR